MISNPKYGWCDFELGDFHGHPSYLTDVPVDLLGAFISYFENGTGTAFFDEEESEFTLILKHHAILIMEEKETLVCHEHSDLDAISLAKELIFDILRDRYTWCIEFDLHIETDKDIENKLQYIDSLVKKLKEYIDKNEEYTNC